MITELGLFLILLKDSALALGGLGALPDRPMLVSPASVVSPIAPVKLWSIVRLLSAIADWARP